MPEGGLADLRAGAAVHGEPAAASATTSTERCAARASRLSSAASRAACGVRTATRGRSRVRAKSATSWSATRRPASSVTTRSAVARGLLGVAGGEEHRAAPGGVGAQQPVQPAASRGGRARRPGSSRTSVCGSPSSAQARPSRRSMPTRERAEALVAQADEADDFEQLVGAGGGHPGGGAEHAELAADGTRGWPGTSPRSTPDLAGGVGDAVQRAAAEVGDSAALFEFEHQPQRRGLARAGGAEERGDARPAGPRR